MNIKLLYPPSTSQNHSGGPVLGLAVLQGYLNSAGIKTEIDDLEIKCIDKKIDVCLFEERSLDVIKYLLGQCSGEKLEHVLKQILGLTNIQGWSYVGFSIMGIRQFLITLALAKIIKESYKSKIVLGGFYPQSNAAAILNRFAFVDYIVVQEGELALKQLLTGVVPSKIPNLWYRTQQGVMGSHHQQLVLLNENPVADFSGLPLSLYKKYKSFLEIPYELARGCSADCSFCSFPKFNGLRIKSIRKIIDELSQLKRTYNTNRFIFYNAEVNISNSWLKRFLKEVINQKLDIQWVGYLIPNLDEESVQLIKESGCMEVKLGFESGSCSILEKMNKRQSVEEAKHSIELLSQYGIPFYCFFITGYPHETLDDHLQTLKFISQFKGKIKKARVTEYELEFNSLMYKKPQEYGIIRREPKQKVLLPTLKIPFDEASGLSWEDKIKQQGEWKAQIEWLFKKYGITVGNDYCRFK